MNKPAAFAWLVIFIHALALLSQWPLLPFFVDTYYHLNVAAAFRECGGIATHAYWEWAPGGRPHLYPPLLHVAMLMLDWLELSPIDLGRLMSVATYVALQAATWWCAKVWLGSRTAFWAVICAVLPYSYLLVTCNTLAASWAMVAWLVGLVAVYRKAFFASVLLVAVVFYTHLGSPWLMVFSWIFLGAFLKERRQIIFSSLAAGFVLSLPWLLHLWNHRSAWSAVSTYENQLIEVPLVLYLLAIAAACFLFQGKHRLERAFLLSLLAGCLPLLFNYSFRFFSGQGLLPIVLLAGFSLFHIEKWLLQPKGGKVSSFASTFSVLLAAGLFVFNATLFTENKTTVLIGDTALSHLLFQDNRMPRSNAVSFYYPKLMDPLAALAKEKISADGLISCNDPYLCAVLSALSGRATTTGMLAEVSPESGAGDIANSQLYFKFKRLGTLSQSSGKDFQGLDNFNRVLDSPMATVYANPNPAALKRKARPVVGLLLTKGLLATAILFIIADLWRNRRVVICA